MRSNTAGPLETLATPIAQAAAQFQSLPLLEKNRRRAGGGAGLIAFCLYAVIAAPGLVFAHWIPPALGAAALAYGLLRFVVGVRGALGPRDIMDGFWHGVFIVVCAGLLWCAYLPADWGGWAITINILLRGLYIAGIVSSTVRGWLALRGMPTARLDEVRTQQAHGSARDATPAEAAAKLGDNTPRPQRQFQS
jgi:hypothetical protein